MKKPSVESMVRPEVAVPAVYGLFLGLAFLSYRLNITTRYLFTSSVFDGPAGLLSYIITILGLATMVLCALAARRVFDERHYPILRSLALAVLFLVTALTIHLTLPIHPVLSLGASAFYVVLLWTISRYVQDIRLVTVAAGSFALVSALLVSVLSGGIPLLDPVARGLAAMSPFRALFHGFALFCATLAVVYYGRKYLLVAVLLALAGVISGFKSDAVSILLSASIGGLISGKVRLKEVGGVLVLILAILTLMSTHLAVLAFGKWNIPPLFYPFYRAGFTFLVFDRALDLALPWGLLKGGAILSTSQEVVSTAVLGYATPHIITSTLFGPLTLDFGLVGTLLTACFLGLYFGVLGGYRGPFQTALYAIILTHTLILIEVGLQMTSLILFISVLFLFLSWKDDG